MMKGKVKGKEQKSSKLKIFIVKTRPLEISWLLPQKKKKRLEFNYNICIHFKRNLFIFRHGNTPPM